MSTQPLFNRLKAAWLSPLLLGVAQILVWGGSFFLPAVLADPVTRQTHWPQTWVYGSLSIALALSGLIAPWVGRYITRQRANGLLLYSGLVLALGLVLIALAPWLWLFVLGWCVIGLAMAMGLYDTLFALLGKQYGIQAKGMITQITLISGFTTTVIWPLLAGLIAQAGWRYACLGYALLVALLIGPLYKIALSDQSLDPMATSRTTSASPAPVAIDGPLFGLTALNFTLAAVIMTALSVQLLTVLQAKGLSLVAAVSIGTLIGPAQVGVRALDLVLPKRPPIWTTFLSGILTVAGVVILGLPAPFAAVGVVLYSLGNGMRAILRGTLPLELFGLEAYPTVLGRLARPALLAQAITPLIGGYLVQQYGVSFLIGLLAVLGLLNIGLTAAIKLRWHHFEQTNPSQPVLSH